MSRIRGILKWDPARNVGRAVADNGQIFHIQRKHFRQPPMEKLVDGMSLEFSKLTTNFVERLYDGKARDDFSGSHRNPRPKGTGRYPVAIDITMVSIPVEPE